MSTSKLSDFLKSLDPNDYTIDHNNKSEFNVNNIVKNINISTLLGVVIKKGYNYIAIRYSNGAVRSYNFSGSRLYADERSKVIFHVKHVTKIPKISYY